MLYKYFSSHTLRSERCPSSARVQNPLKWTFDSSTNDEDASVSRWDQGCRRIYASGMEAAVFLFAGHALRCSCFKLRRRRRKMNGMACDAGNSRRELKEQTRWIRHCNACQVCACVAQNGDLWEAWTVIFTMFDIGPYRAVRATRIPRWLHMACSRYDDKGIGPSTATRGTPAPFPRRGAHPIRFGIHLIVDLNQD